MRLSGFVLLIAFANLALFQKPLLAFVFSVSSLPDATGWLQLASVQIVQLCLFMGVLFLVSALSLRLMKLVVVLLFIVNAAALYFMLSYSIEIDRSMIANVLNTDTGEASGLWHCRSCLISLVLVLCRHFLSGALISVRQSALCGCLREWRALGCSSHGFLRRQQPGFGLISMPRGWAVKSCLGPM